MHPSRRAPSGKKKKLVAADRIRTWDVGIRLGPALRKALAGRKQSPGPSPSSTEQSAQPGRPSLRPHWRRGHWHHYWTGPRSQPTERKIILHWLPPIPVGISEFNAPPTPAVVRRVVKSIKEHDED